MTLDSNNIAMMNETVDTSEVVKTDLPVVSLPKIDKITIVFDLPDAQHQQNILGYTWDLKHYPVGGLKPGAYKGYKGAISFTGLNKDGSTPTNAILLQFGPKKNPTAAFCRIEFNPSKVTNAQLAALRKFLFNDLSIDLPGALAAAWITRLDICCDVSGVTMEEFHATAARKRFTMMGFGTDGRIETAYLGKMSGAQVKIYDKAKEAGLDEAVTRIEVSLKKRLMFKELTSVKNPFLNVLLYDLSFASDSADNDFHSCFRDSCRQRGIKNALKRLNTGNRKALSKLVKGTKAAWWAPEIAWPERWQCAVETAGLLPEQALVKEFSYGQA